MKIIKTYSSEHIINDNEIDIIVKNSSSDKLLLLDNGDYIRPKSIIVITEPELVPYWNGYLLNKDGRSFERDGTRVYLETNDFEEIEYKPHPKYVKLSKIKKLSQKNE